MSDPVTLKAARLQAALEAADRFTDAAFALRRAEERCSSNPRESGALRRASMDLTRALADWRRSPYQGE